MQPSTIVDRRGYAIFATGDHGTAHRAAHEALDRGAMREGAHELGRFLSAHEVAGSPGLHLQWHQLVFEVHIGQWARARARFERWLLPAALHTDLVATDAPAALWWLTLTAPANPPLPWAAVRDAFVARRRGPSAPFAELHHLLLLAGAGDRAGLAAWSLATPPPASPTERSLHDWCRGLRAWVDGDLEAAASILQTIPLDALGGSHGQHRLLERLRTPHRRAA